MQTHIQDTPQNTDAEQGQRVLIRRCTRHKNIYENIVVTAHGPWQPASRRSRSGGEIFISDCNQYGINIPEGQTCVRVFVEKPTDIVAYTGSAPYVANDDVVAEVDDRTADNVIAKRIQERFEFSARLAEQVIDDKLRFAIFSGPGGLGKSFLVKQKIQKATEENLCQIRVIKGNISAVMLYKLLWENRSVAHVLVFDDCDGFVEEDCINLFKAATDTDDPRMISWEKDSSVLKKYDIPQTFRYHGRIIFITNIDFDREIAKNNSMSPHLDALLTRSVYVNFTINTSRERAIRVLYVLEHTDMLSQNQHTKNLIVEFISNNRNRFRDLSLRAAVQMARIAENNPDDWQRMCAYQFFQPSHKE